MRVRDRHFECHALSSHIPYCYEEYNKDSRHSYCIKKILYGSGHLYAFLNQHRKLFRMHKHHLILQKQQYFTSMQTMSNPSFYDGYTPYK